MRGGEHEGAEAEAGALVLLLTEVSLCGHQPQLLHPYNGKMVSSP